MTSDEGNSTRRSFLKTSTGLAAAAGLGGAVGVGATTAASGSEIPEGTFQPLDPDSAGLPYRQDDPRWGHDLMWDRSLVVDVARQKEGFSAVEAAALMREFPDGNNIANEGCQLTCLAMVLRLLDPSHKPAWTPGNLNAAAHEGLYYTLSGLSVSTMYADIVSDLTDGLVQLIAKEEYPAGQSPWPSMTTANSPLASAYLGLDQKQRGSCLVMLKTGTWDDTVASHYALIDPTTQTNSSANDPNLLDPAMPADHEGPWNLTDSARWILQDPEIKKAWQSEGISPTQIGGVWAFSIFDRESGLNSSSPLAAAWAKQLGNRDAMR